MEITHLPEDNLFKTVVDGYTAYVTYIIRDGKLDQKALKRLRLTPKSEAGGSQLN